MRIPKQNRRQRRGQPIDTIIKANAARRFNAWSEKDREAIEREIMRMVSRIKTLHYDESKKAKTAHSAAQVVAESAIWNENTTIEERAADFVTPRKPLTEKLMLRLFPQVLEFRDVTQRTITDRTRAILADIAAQVAGEHPINQAEFRDRLMIKAGLMDKATRELTIPFIETTEPAELIWKSDATLLVSRKPDVLSTVKVTRETANKRTFEQESSDFTDLPTWDETTPRTWDDEQRDTSPASEPALDGIPTLGTRS